MRLSGAAAVLAVAVAMLGGAVGAVAAGGSPSPTAGSLQWTQWQHLVGVFDVGLQPDGAGLVAEGSELFFDIDRSGNMVAINTPTAFHDVVGYEAYFAVSAGEPTSGSCRFRHGAMYVLDPRSTKQVLEVDQNSGQATPFATIPGVDSLNGIAFDDTGAFGEHPLLVTGPSASHSVVAAIGCHGDVTTVSASAPRMEGGISVAPRKFGSHGGELIGVDEIGGDIIGIGSSGTVATLVNLPQPKGGDLGVESTGFVPVDFMKHGGAAYLADRGTANNPHPGTDSLLRLTSSQLATAGVHEGDLLVATEGGGVTVDVTCAASCALRQVATGPAPGHIEGHIAFLNNLPALAPAATAPPSPHAAPPASSSHPARTLDAVGIAVAAAGLVLLAVVVALVVRARREG